MAKRHLTRRQSWRIEKIQEERAARAARRESRAVEELEGGDLGPEQTGQVIAHFGVQVEVESADGQVSRCHLRANLPALVTGDQVVWRAGNQGIGVIVAQLPRRSELCRPDMRGLLKPVAANVDRIVIVFAPRPEPHANLIDRYLIAAEHAGIQPLLLLNKADLVDESNAEGIDALLNVYRTLGYTTARLFHFPGGGDLIDSPGIREFGLGHVSRDDVEAGFIEFRDLLGHCRFRDCKHDREPGCALLQALEDGRIMPQRMASYRHILASMPETDY